MSSKEAEKEKLKALGMTAKEMIEFSPFLNALPIIFFSRLLRRLSLIRFL